MVYIFLSVLVHAKHILDSECHSWSMSTSPLQRPTTYTEIFRITTNVRFIQNGWLYRKYLKSFSLVELIISLQYLWCKFHGEKIPEIVSGGFTAVAFLEYFPFQNTPPLFNLNKFLRPLSSGVHHPTSELRECDATE